MPSKVHSCFDNYADLADDFADGSHIIYVNGENRDNTSLGCLMHDFFCTKAQNMHYNILAEKIRYFKETEEEWQSDS